MNPSAGGILDGRVLWHSIGSLPMVIAALAIFVIVVPWLYRPQLRFISRPWRWVLPALRVIALAALAMSVLKPAIIRARSAVQDDALVVLVDRSRSMNVADTSRTPAQLVALADALGMLPQDVQRRDIAVGFDAILETLRQCADEVQASRAAADVAALQPERLAPARRELDGSVLRYRSAMSSLTLRSQTLALAHLNDALEELSNIPLDLPPDVWRQRVDASIARAETALAELRADADEALYQSNGVVKSICDALSARSRMDLTAQWLTRNETRQLLDRHGPVHLFGFGGADDVQALPWPTRTPALTADRAVTDIQSALGAAATNLRGRLVRAYLVLSDGRDTVMPRALSRASHASPDDAPIFMVNLAVRSPLPDVSIDRVSLPASQFIGDQITVRSDVRHRGMAGKAVDVRLSAGAPQSAPDAAAQQQHQRIVLPDSAIISVEFNLKADVAPAQKIEISVDPVASEATMENNSHVRIVKVASEKINVAAWSGSPAWDFQYLRNTLARTPWIELDEAIFPSEAAKLAVTPQQILEKDVIILHDLAVGSLDGSQWQAISQFVVERGASLILIAGDAHLPAEYGQNELLASLLPYRGGLKPVWRVWPGPTPAFQLMPAPGTEAIEALRLSDDPVEGRQRWNVLPGWYRYLSIAQLKSNSTPLLIERDSKAPVLTESRLGLGRVLFFGGNETWRWRYKSGEALQDRFWLQLVRYAAGAAYAASNGQGAFLDLESLLIEPAGGVRARCRVRDAEGTPSAQARQMLRLLRNGQELFRQNMPPAEGGAPGRYETFLAMPETEGDYQVELMVDPPVRLDVRVRRNMEAEMRDVSSDEPAMRRLARRSGGEYLPIERISELDALLQSRHVNRTILAEYPLWDSPYLFFFIVACLGVEWALRKSLGLA